MTLFISIFSILMVILANHPTNSGASNLQEEVISLTSVITSSWRFEAPEVRLQRSERHMKPLKRGRKKHQRSKKNHNKSKKKQTGKSKRKGRKSANRDEAKPAKGKFMSRKFDPNFEFRACDYLDLVEVGYS